MLAEDTIAAISTPPGEGAVAVIRISGPDSITIAGKIFKGRMPVAEAAARTFYFGSFEDAGERVDEGLLAVFRAPHSYTGENLVELHGHGGILVAAKLLETVLKAGARAAEPGEFTQRAFVNGKMDLTQAEAVMDVIRARTPLALRAAGAQLEGRLGKAVDILRDRVLQIVAHVEAYIDFPEEGIDPRVGQQMIADIDSIIASIDQLLGTANEGRILREGVRLVLCGEPNAGKSSLLNRLLGFERAIVSPTPGTTRDTLEEFASLRGIPFRITDTAGLRETDDLIEREGVERAKRAIASADIVVRVVDITAEHPPTVETGEIVAINKTDLAPAPRLPDAIAISCHTGTGIDALVEAIVSRARGGLSSAPSGAAINARHQACLTKAREQLAEAARELRADAPPEIAATHLREALDAVGEIVGRADVEEILGRIFSTFCIGK